MPKKPEPKKPPNPAAKALADARHRPKVMKAKKGKGSYRRDKSAGPAADGAAE